LVLLRENTETPRDEEWDETLRMLTLPAHELSRVKVLVVTDGGGPSLEQRKRLNRTLDGKPLLAAVVSDSVKVRFIVSTVALFMPQLHCFRMAELEAAFTHVGLEGREREAVRHNLAEMAVEVAARGTPPRARKPS
jgi:hypothetical protein